MAKLVYMNSGYPFANSSGSTIAAGDPVVNNALFGVAAATIENNATGWIYTEGTFDIDAKSADTAQVGAVAYWDSSNDYVTVTASTNLPIGYFVEAKASSETVARIKLGAYIQAAAGVGG